MTDPKFQAIWHHLNQAQVSLVMAHDETEKRADLLAEAQLRAKRADVLLRELIARRDVEPLNAGG